MEQRQESSQEGSRDRPRRSISGVSFLVAFLFVWLVFDNLALGLIAGLIFGGGSEVAQRGRARDETRP